MKAEKKKIIYFGLDALIGCLHFIIGRGLEVVKIFTFPDDGYDKTQALTAFATQRNIPVSYNRPTLDELQALRDSGVGLMVVAGYPWKIPTVETMRQVNIHPSLLPVGRGPWPMPVSLLNRTDSGVTLHKLSDLLDGGDILLQQRIPFDPQDTLVSLTEKIKTLAVALLERFLANSDELWENALPQPAGEYWPEPDRAQRTFSLTDSVEKIDRILKAFYGYETLTCIYGIPLKIIEGEIADRACPGCLCVPMAKGYLICKKWDYAFRRIRLSDREKMEAVRQAQAPLLSDYTYSLLYCWQQELGLGVYLEEDFFVVKTRNEFFFPMGEMDKALGFIEGLLKLEGCVRLRFCDEKMKNAVVKRFGSRAAVVLAESDCDYLISHKKIHTLAGKKLSKRRTEYNGFIKKHTNLSLERINETNIHRVKALADRKSCEYGSAESVGLEHYFQLGLIGVIVSSNGEDLGFAICAKKDAQTLQGHFLKNMCVEHSSMFYLLKLSMDYFSDEYSFTNIEDDMGIEGLRFFKKSLDPEVILSYNITVKEADNRL